MSEYDPDDNSRRSWELAIKAAREKCIRSHAIAPRERDAQEQRWAAEGPVPPSELESVKHG